MEDRRRSKIFSDYEKQVLLSLVEDQIGTLESKKSDSRSIVVKKKTLDMIADQFNKNSEITRRSSDQLKKCWENMKSRAKTDVATEKRERRATGGGTLLPTAMTNPVSSQIIGLIPSQMQPLLNPFDEDANYHDVPGKFYFTR